MYTLTINGKHGFKSTRNFSTLNECKMHVHSRYEISSIHATIKANGEICAYSPYNESKWVEGKYATMFCPIVGTNGGYITF